MKQIDYFKFMSRKTIENSIEDEPVIHLLSGGTFKASIFAFGILWAEKEEYSDHCDCKVKNKCNKVLPIVLSNN